MIYFIIIFFLHHTKFIYSIIFGSTNSFNINPTQLQLKFKHILIILLRPKWIKAPIHCSGSGGAGGSVKMSPETILPPPPMQNNFTTTAVVCKGTFNLDRCYTYILRLLLLI